MFNMNWNILIAIFVVILVILYFRNCYEGFATNDEAIAAVASLYNTNNMTVGNFNASTANITGGSLKISGNPAENDKLIVNVNGTGDNADRYLYFNKSGNLGVWSPSKGGSWSIDPNGNAIINGTLTANTANITNNLTANGITSNHESWPLTLGKDKKKFLFHIPTDEKRNQLMLAPFDPSGNPLWSNSLTLQNDGGVRVSGDKGLELIQMGFANYTGPIYGGNKQTYSASEYICILMNSGFDIGIKNNIWWIKALNQSPSDSMRDYPTIICIPLKYFSFIHGGAIPDRSTFGRWGSVSKSRTSDKTNTWIDV